ncbi:MAG: GNAT family N-acetyltransferase [Bacillota bacterium]|nr:GNAT family N-acetyltransferase [Bacillota bacterium]
MYGGISVERMKSEHIEAAAGLWQRQFSRFCGDECIFPFWENSMRDIYGYLASHAESGQGFTAMLENRVAGYFAYDTASFHGSGSAFVPFAGNAAEFQDRYYIFSALYKAASQAWADAGIKNHYFTICLSDEAAKNWLFDLGFGSYVVDAFNIPGKAQKKPEAKDNIIIARAQPDDFNNLFEIVNESCRYYSRAPLFLAKDHYFQADLEKLIKGGKVFIAKDSGAIIGFMNLSVAQDGDIFSMCGKGFGRIDEIGAYIKEEYRNKNVGAKLLSALNEYCAQNGIPCVHVDFESANLYGNRFWRKHFTPVMLSLRRTLHNDM